MARTMCLSRKKDLVKIIFSLKRLLFKPIHWYIAVVSFSFAISSVNSLINTIALTVKQEDQSLGGITSLLLLEDGEMIAGTKFGKVFHSHRRQKEGQSVPLWTELGHCDSKFPVYSLASGKGKDIQRPLLFCGGGDRYVTVRDGHCFDIIENLGPHTGWVRDMTYDSDEMILFSIGCNFIQAWDCSSDSVSSLLNSRTITSSAAATTLSSDLLCLCLAGDQRLISGGVDGRIHMWASDFSIAEPLCSKGLHEGRVNSLVYSSLLRTIFSFGSDGKVIALNVLKDSLISISVLKVEGSPRLTAASIVHESDKKILIVVGTANGQVLCIRAELTDNDGITICEESRVELNTNPMIYALCCRSYQLAGSVNNNSKVLYAAHAKGVVSIKASSPSTFLKYRL